MWLGGTVVGVIVTEGVMDTVGEGNSLFRPPPDPEEFWNQKSIISTSRKVELK